MIWGVRAERGRVCGTSSEMCTPAPMGWARSCLMREVLASALGITSIL